MEKKSDTDKTTAKDWSGMAKDSAQQIWLAGLGAFAKAQQEGGKVFETLVKEGLAIQRKTQSVAEEKIAEAAQRMSSLASDVGAKAGSPWGKLEDIFEERVARSLTKLGVPSQAQFEQFSERIAALEKRVAALAAAPRTSAGKPVARRARRTE